VIILVGGYFIYNSINSNGTVKQEIAKTDTTTNNNEIGPGGNKAILTLADGSTINLESAVTETLTQQGNTTLLKSDGQLTYKSLNEKPAQIFLNNVTTPRGGQYQLTLSDGSKVWLNAASSIEFPAAFTGNERTVKITGEVYFEVAKNASMPFKVKIADKGEVEVLGTHFNINAYSDEATIKTTLLEGSVKVTGLRQNNSTTIIPGEQAQISAKNKINVNKIENVEDVIAWKNGTFNFDNADLETSLRQIARWYDVDIIFEGVVPNKKFSGEMQRDLSLPQVIKLLEKNNVYCRIEGRNLFVLK
jgi:ferric-dicitrate binding protein FerR (iron transport regulator)